MKPTKPYAIRICEQLIALTLIPPDSTGGADNAG